MTDTEKTYPAFKQGDIVKNKITGKVYTVTYGTDAIQFKTLYVHREVNGRKVGPVFTMKSENLEIL